MWEGLIARNFIRPLMIKALAYKADFQILNLKIVLFDL